MKRFAIAAALVFSLAPRSLHAQPRNREFDRLVQQAVQAYDAQDGATAIQLLQRAYAMRPLPRLLYNLGRAHELAGDFSTAATYYQRFLASNPDRDSAAVAQEALNTAVRRAEAQNEERRRREAAEQAAREAQAAELARQQALAQSEAERQRNLLRVGVTHPRRITVPVGVAWGVAGVGAVAAGVFGALALSAQSDFNSNRDGNARDSASSTGSAMAIGADVALGTAVVAGVTGLVLFLTQPTTEAAP